MLWVIEPTGKVSAEYEKDMERLQGNKAVRKNLENIETSLSAADANKELATALKQGEPLYVLAHGGLDPKPWLGGLDFAGFVEAVGQKFGTVKQRDIFLLVCEVGVKLDDLFGLLKSNVANVRLFVPRGLMYISNAGIPHVFSDGTKVKWADEQVAAHDAAYKKIDRSLACGEGWVGLSFKAGTREDLDKQTVRAAIVEHFDPQGRES